MELRAVDGERVADKTVLKMMREMGLRCGIRHETDYRRYNSYRGVVGETFENVLGRDFAADGPWRKMGTDVTEFKLSFGRAYLAPVYDFGSREIVAHSISTHPDLAQQEEMLAMLAEAKPAWSEPIMQMDMGWQYQHAEFVAALKGMGVVQSMSRKGNCLGQRMHGGDVRPPEGRVPPRARLGHVRGVQGGPGGLHPPLEQREAPGQAEGPDPGGVPEQALREAA